MKALCWTGKERLSVEKVNDPGILNPHDAIIKVGLSSVCGSDLHIINGFVPSMKEGDIIGHEFMGEIVETGSEVRNLKRGDRVVVCSVIGCGECGYCQNDQWSLCDNTNPNGTIQEKLYGYPTAGIYGYTHLFGGYAGSHAEYIRVPFAEKGAFKIPDDVPDDKALFASDAMPTGFMGADMADIEPGDVVAVWGCGAVGQMAIRASYLMGASRVIAIDCFEDRLEKASKFGLAETINYEKENVLETLKEMTAGRGPDSCIDAVGMEANTKGIQHTYDKVKQAMRMETERPAALREAIMACRKGGTVSVIGVYAGFADKFPTGMLMNKNLTLRGGQMHGQKYIPKILEYIQQGKLDPSYLTTHRMALEQGMEGYQLFNSRKDNCLRVVFAPNSN